jgi:hypothetical protein
MDILCTQWTGIFFGCRIIPLGTFKNNIYRLWFVQIVFFNLRDNNPGILNKKRKYLSTLLPGRNWRRSSGWVSALDCPAERRGGGGRFAVRPQPLRHGGDLYARIRCDRKGPASLHLSVSYATQDNWLWRNYQHFNGFFLFKDSNNSINAKYFCIHALPNAINIIPNLHSGSGPYY